MSFVSKIARKIIKKAAKLNLVRALSNKNVRVSNRIIKAYDISAPTFSKFKFKTINIGGGATDKLKIVTNENFNEKSLAFQAFQRTNNRMSKNINPGLSLNNNSRKEVFGKELTKASRRYTTLQLKLTKSQKNGIKQAEIIAESVKIGGVVGVIVADLTRYADRRKNTISVGGKQLYDKSGRLGKVRDGYKMVYGKLRRVRAN